MQGIFFSTMHDLSHAWSTRTPVDAPQSATRPLSAVRGSSQTESLDRSRARFVGHCCLSSGFKAGWPDRPTAPASVLHTATRRARDYSAGVQSPADTRSFWASSSAARCEHSVGRLPRLPISARLEWPGDFVDVREPEDPSRSAPPAVWDLAREDAHPELGMRPGPPRIPADSPRGRPRHRHGYAHWSRLSK